MCDTVLVGSEQFDELVAKKDEAFRPSHCVGWLDEMKMHHVSVIKDAKTNFP